MLLKPIEEEFLSHNVFYSVDSIAESLRCSWFVSHTYIIPNIIANNFVSHLIVLDTFAEYYWVHTEREHIYLFIKHL